MSVAAAQSYRVLLRLPQLLAGVGVLEGVLHSAAEVRELGDERAAAFDRRLEFVASPDSAATTWARPAVSGRSASAALTSVFDGCHVVEERIDGRLRVVSFGCVRRYGAAQFFEERLRRFQPLSIAPSRVSRVAPGLVIASAASVAIVSTCVRQDAMLVHTSVAHASSSAELPPPPPQPAATSARTMIAASLTPQRVTG